MNDKITREQAAQIIDNALDDYLKVARSEAPLNFTDTSIKSVEHTSLLLLEMCMMESLWYIHREWKI